MELMVAYSTTSLHLSIADSNPPLMRYDPAADYYAQKTAISARFRELLGMPEKMTAPVPLIEYCEQSNPEYDEIRFAFESEPGFFVPAHMLLPKNVYGMRRAQVPAVITLQGHSSGMHISLGRAKYPGDEESIAGDRDFAVQAVRRGFAAIAMEQRGFGELRGDIDCGPAGRCHHLSMQALMLGRTMIGERAHDVGRLIDALGAFEELDLSRLGLMGNSGGGTASFYTTCVEPRIKIAMPSCSFCMNRRSIFAMYHCCCNYVPGMLKYVDMCDLSILIAPRPLVIVAGRADKIFPIESVLEGFETVQKIYAQAGAPGNCRLIIGEGGHRFYAEQGWKAFGEYV